jgi:hypothetical protein
MPSLDDDDNRDRVQDDEDNVDNESEEDKEEDLDIPRRSVFRLGDIH